MSQFYKIFSAEIDSGFLWVKLVTRDEVLVFALKHGDQMSF
jgi:hypothetical protein